MHDGREIKVMESAMFTVKETATRIGVSGQLVYALCASRRLRHVRVGLGRGTIRIPEDAVDEFLRGRTVAVGDIPGRPPPTLTHIRLPAVR